MTFRTRCSRGQSDWWQRWANFGHPIKWFHEGIGLRDTDQDTNRLYERRLSDPEKSDPPSSTPGGSRKGWPSMAAKASIQPPPQPDGFERALQGPSAYDPWPDVPVPNTPGVGTGTVRPKYANVAELLANGIPEPPAPDYLTREDGHRLFYRGTVNVLFGDPESGKSWVALAACQEALSAGGSVLFVDSDHNGVATILNRLLLLGAPQAALADLDKFRYISPEDSTEMLAVVADSRTNPPDIAVVDSVGELIPMFGGSSNSPDYYSSVNRAVMRPIADQGAAVLLVDHLAKNTASRDFGPTGTAAKRRTIDGVSLRVVLREAFAPGQGGCCALSINKDRHGGVRAHCPTGPGNAPAGLFRLIPTGVGSGLDWTVSAPTESDAEPHQPTPRRHIPEVDATELGELDPGPKSVVDVKSRKGWGTDRSREALAAYRRTGNVPGTQVQTVGELIPMFGGSSNSPTAGLTCNVCDEPMTTDFGNGSHPTCETL